jgi:hypothetical protein
LPLVSASWPHLSFDIPKPHSSAFWSGIRRCLRSNKDRCSDMSLRALRGPTSQQLTVKGVEPSVTRVNSTNVLDEGLRIGEIGRRMNSKVKLIEIGVYRK